MDYVLLMEGGLNPFKCMVDALMTQSMLKTLCLSLKIP